MELDERSESNNIEPALDGFDIAAGEHGQSLPIVNVFEVFAMDQCARRTKNSEA